jgi:hypothetical protein
MSDSQLDRIEIEVAPYSAPAPVEPMRFDVSHELAAMLTRARADEFVTIAAHGSYGVASDRAETIWWHRADRSGEGSFRRLAAQTGEGGGREKPDVAPPPRPR